ncbi:cysteine-rich DPF motif domain-containing protein 1 [Aphidius gifuensis]|uniref:cysteine-rich DPF motif domain-containing protein 1 n=1 Tax=Aphidius gifuensis TaxID=684658 RepID=UPI001CDC2098|nr:cysteine-rich DPF motif domain-containing protein 1 [Aphidius gifuensis]
MENNKDDKRDVGGNFECSSCKLYEKFDYKGTKPPFARNILFLEDCYVMKDPFSLPNRGEVLVIGGDCSICNKQICSNCSIFYAKRFCNECLTNNVDKFPVQLITKIINTN